MNGWTRGAICASLTTGLMVNTACSLKKTAVNAVADVLAESEGVYLSDEDPELIEAALPFNIKTIETLLVTSPEHRGLLLSAATSLMTWPIMADSKSHTTKRWVTAAMASMTSRSQRRRISGTSAW